MKYATELEEKDQKLENHRRGIKMIIGRMEYYKGRARSVSEIDDLTAMQAILRDVFDGI